MMRRSFGTLAYVAGLTLLLFYPGNILCQDVAQDVAAVTGLPETLLITDYDIFLRTDLEANSLHLKVISTLLNQGPDPIGQVDFDLLAKEIYYGVKIHIAQVERFVNGGFVPQKFSRGALSKPDDPSMEGSDERPKITRVILTVPLKPNEKIQLRFEYTIIHTDPKQKSLPYRIIAWLPNGSKEVCLLTDFSWIPWVTWKDYEKLQELDESNFFVKHPRPTWKMSIQCPSAYEAMVVDGRLEKTEKEGRETITQWKWRTGGFPQVFMGQSDKIEVKGKEASVTFILARGGYERGAVEAMGKFLIRAFQFFTELFGPLSGNEMHIAASSAGMGGHGAFLGTFLDIQSFQKKIDESKSADFFDETAAHELAHSWWGISISSYGRGTKFLREAFCNYGTWQYTREILKRDLFQENLAYLFFRGNAKSRLFEATRDNQNLAYTKGALILDLLRQEMGDEVFYAVLKQYGAKYKDTYVTFVDFVSLCNEITRRDWMPFFNQWCYSEGYPIYHLVNFESTPDDGGWKTIVTVRNDGEGTVRCPLSLQMADRTQEEIFRVPQTKIETFAYRTPLRVTQVAIDAHHRAYQGDEKEARLKILGIKETEWGWMNYWIAVLKYELGDSQKSLELLSKAVAGQEEILGPNKASPALYFSRGIIYLSLKEKEKANEDIRLFMDGVMGTGGRSKELNSVIQSLSYATLVSGTAEERKDQLLQILKLLTGNNLPLDPDLSAWRKWWEAHRTSFVVSPNAASLNPTGIK